MQKPLSLGTGDCMGIRQLLACRRLCLTRESGGVGQCTRAGIMGLQAACLHRAAPEIIAPHICTAPITRGWGPGLRAVCVYVWDGHEGGCAKGMERGCPWPLHLVCMQTPAAVGSVR